jgi:16S rRNA processing protein RimM
MPHRGGSLTEPGPREISGLLRAKTFASENSMAENYRNIGKLVAVHGLQGELVLLHRLGRKTTLKGLKTIFLEERKDEMLPWFIQDTRLKSDEEIFVKLEGLDTKESARRVVQKEVWLTEKDFAHFAGKSAPIAMVGFRLIDSGKDIGEILEVIEQPHQVLCRIDLEGKEALIPVHDQTLKMVDQRKREVHVELPDGLLDIYR